MPRQARLDAPGTLHHVIARGIERQKIFKDEVDCADFLQRVEGAVTRGGATVFAWALIPNHFHLVLRTGETPLSSVMRRILTGYAVAHNLRHHRHGHLFQNRYKSIVCEAEVYLLELVRYVHLNPLRAKVVSSYEDLVRYPYSGHSAVLGEVERPWQATGEVLGRFGCEETEARRGYGEFVQAGIDNGRRPDLVGGGLRRSSGGWLEGANRRKRGEEPLAHDERVLGSPGFVTEILEEAGWERRAALRTHRESLDVLAKGVAELASISQHELRSGSKRPAVVTARAALALVAVGTFGYSGAAVARYLGVAASTVNRQVTHTEQSPLADRLRESLEW